jgi:iron complex outermembrane receptor protein
VVGASSAFYGPNAFNGVIAMETKNPFFNKGLAASVKVGERSLVETAFRFADVIKNKSVPTYIAYKLNFSYLSANDWVADNYNPVTDSTNNDIFYPKITLEDLMR